MRRVYSARDAWAEALLVMIRIIRTIAATRGNLDPSGLEAVMRAKQNAEGSAGKFVFHAGGLACPDLCDRNRVESVLCQMIV